MLILMLERYNKDREKDETPLDIPLVMKPYPDPAVPNYELVGASQHIGQTLESGHYTSLIVNNKEDVLNIIKVC